MPSVQELPPSFGDQAHMPGRKDRVHVLHTKRSLGSLEHMRIDRDSAPPVPPVPAVPPTPKSSSKGHTVVMERRPSRAALRPSAKVTSCEEHYKNKNSMRSVFTDPAHRLYVDDAPLPKPLPDECVVRVRASGICGSDCTSWRKGSIGGHDVKAPLRLGHESAGEIVAVGSSVRNLKLGDRVCIEPGIACGSCRQCRSGWYNLCPQVKFISVAPCHGTLAEYVAHPASWLHKLSPETDFREGALIEPMSIALASVRRADLKLGHSVAIIGAGSIGLMIYLLAKASGATPITLVDSSQARLDFAVSALGVRPSEVVRADPQGTHTAEAARIIESMSGTRPNIVFECTGFPGPVHVAIEALELGGVLTEVGIGANVDDLPFSDMLHRQIDLRFVMRANSCFEDCVKLLENGIVNPRPLVTHNYTLEEAPTAFAAASHPQAGAVKVHIVS